MALEVDWQILTTICRSHESRHLDRCRQGVWEALGAFGTDQLISSSLAGLLYLHARTFRRPRFVTLGRPIKKGLAMEEMSIRCRRVEGLCELHAASAAPLRVAVAVPIETNRPSMIGCRTRGQRPQCPQGCPDSSSVGPGARLQGLRCLVQRTSSQYLLSSRCYSLPTSGLVLVWIKHQVARWGRTHACRLAVDHRWVADQTSRVDQTCSLPCSTITPYLELNWARHGHAHRWLLQLRTAIDLLGNSLS